MQLLINYNPLITIHRHQYTKENSSTNMVWHLKVSPIDWFKEMFSTCFSTIHMHNCFYEIQTKGHIITYITTCFNQSQVNPSLFVMPVSFCCLHDISFTSNFHRGKHFNIWEIYFAFYLTFIQRGPVFILVHVLKDVLYY